MTNNNDHHDFASAEDAAAFEAMANDLAWDNVRQPILEGVSQRKRKKRILFWLFGLSLVLFGLATILIPSERALAYFPINTENTVKEAKLQPSAPIANSLSDNSSNTMTTHPSISENQGIVAEQLIIITTKDALHVEQYAQKVETVITTVTTPTAKEQQISMTTPPTKKAAISTQLDRLATLDLLPSLPPQDQPIGLVKTTTSVVKNQQNWSTSIWGGSIWHQSAYSTDLAETPPVDIALSGSQFEFRVKKQFSPSFAASTGLRYQMWRSQASTDREYDTTLYRPNTIDTIFNNLTTGEQTFVYTDSMPGLIQHEFQHTNRLHTLQLPIMLSYGQQKGAWNWSGQVGVQFELMQNAEGRKISNANEELQIVTADEWYANDQLLTSWLLEGELGFQISENFSIGARVGIQQPITQRSISVLNGSERINTFYATLGVVKRW